MVILLSYCRTFFLMVLEMSFNVILPLWHKPKITLQGNSLLLLYREICFSFKFETVTSKLKGGPYQRL